LQIISSQFEKNGPPGWWIDITRGRWRSVYSG